MIDSFFWKNKKVFITGHTGFKGSWLTKWLSQFGAKIYGYSLKPVGSPNLYSILNIEDIVEQSVFGDIRNYELLNETLNNIQPDIIIHLAAQPLVINSYIDPLETYSTNINGTINLLQIARGLKNLKVLLNVTTDKVYFNKENGYCYNEEDKLGGYDPYSCSKACGELITSSFRNSYFNDNQIAIATARAGNVIGGGDWSPNRLIPDAVKSFSTNKTLVIRNPKSVRPWQHVLEPLSGYIILCQKLYLFDLINNNAWNFGPQLNNATVVLDIVETFANIWGNNSKWEIELCDNLHEANLLMIDSSKSFEQLNWSSKWDINKTILETANWYKTYYNGGNIIDFTEEQIVRYQNG
jgi:CDP-glucose 4,6-dehydratase